MLKEFKMKKETVRMAVITQEKNMGDDICQYFSDLNNGVLLFDCLVFDDLTQCMDQKNYIDIAILDLDAIDKDSLFLIEEFRQSENPNEVVLLSAYGESEKTNQALLKGAFDFISKPFEWKDLERLVFYANQKRVSRIFQQHSVEITTTHNMKEDLLFIGESEPIKKILKTVSQIAPTDCNVLIQGESGTGKELIARLLHQKSTRKDELFFPINCAAIPENLLESELFGYEKGAFTGAAMRKLGLFEIASKGTLFLDEIGDLPINFQVKLLRVLETGEFNRIGGAKILKTSTRIIAATNKDLKKSVEEGTFRKDLFYRLNVISVFLPPLRERKEDIPLLIDYFIRRQSLKLEKPIEPLSTECLEILKRYHWPGNVRELQNLADRLVILTPSSRITPEMIERNLVYDVMPEETVVEKKVEKIELLQPNEWITLAELEKRYIEIALKKFRFNKNYVANLLGCSERTLYRKIKEYQLEEDEKIFS